MKKIFTLFLLFSFVCIKGWGQISTYSFSASSGTYTALSGATAASPTGTETLFASSGDEGAYNSLPIGFTFLYGGTSYTTISASTNGFATLGATLATGDGLFSGGDYADNNLTDGTGVTSSGDIAPLWDDLDMGSGTFSYQTSGTAGNLIFTMEWKNAIWAYSPFGTTVAISFQAKLYQATGAVQYIYQRVNGTTFNGSPSASIGIGYTNNSLSTTILSLNNSGTSPTASSTETATIAAKPANGQTYTFTPTLAVISSFTPTTGCANTSSVTITGVNLGSATNVSIGGTAATITGTSATQITATVGNGTTGTISVTTPAGTVTSAGTFTVNAAPVITSVTATPGTICSGSISTLTAVSAAISTTSSLGSGTSTTNSTGTGAGLGPNPFQDYYGGSKQQMLITATELTAMGLVNGSQISALQIQLASANTSYALQNYTVRIQNTSLAALTTTFTTAGFTTVYGPSTYTLSGTGYNTISFASSFTWNGTSNLLIEMAYTNSNSPSSASNSAVYSTTSFVSTSFYRADSKTTTDIANQGTANYTYSSRNNLKLSFTRVPAITWTPISGLYTNSGATTAYTSGTNASTVYAKLTNGTASNTNNVYTATATNPISGCTAASNATVTVRPLPTAVLSGTQTICNGSSANLSIAFTGTAPWSVSYTDGTNTYIINNINTNPFIKTVTPVLTTTYNLTILSTNDANCSGGSASGTAVVTVNQKPSITGTYTPTICSGSTFTITPTSSISGTTYTWTAPSYSATSVTGGTAQATGVSTVSGTLANTGINSGTATYTVTPSASSCPGSTFTVTPTVAATLANTIVTGSTTICSGTGVIITFSGAAGSTVSYKKNGTTQTDIGLTSVGNYPLTVPSIIENTTYQLTGAASTTNGKTCTQDLTSTTPAIVSLSLNVLWTGNAGSTNWNTGGNWCSGGAPASGVDVVIGSTNGNYPTLPGNITVANLTINTNNILTLSSNTLTVTGAILGTGNITGSSASSLATGGISTLNLTQTTPGTTNVLRNLMVTGGTLTLGNALNITGGANYGVITVSGSGKLATSGNLTLKSDKNGTAAVGQGAAAGGYITGNVTVERYTDGATTGSPSISRRAWRLMTSPVSGATTIQQAWQENGVNNTGYGTLITGENMATAMAAAAQGYDFTGAGFHASIKKYVPAATSGSWIPLPTTGTTVPVRTEQAYMLFVRGDRTVGANVNSSSVATLRAKGTLLQGTQPAVSLSGGKYTLMGNPYASSIDFSSLYGYNSAVIANQFYLWNSKLGTYGAYILVNKNGSSYQATPSPLTGTGTVSDDAYRYIPSGSGFFVSAATGVTSGGITIREVDKTAGSVPPVSPFRVVPTATDVRQFIVNLNLRDSVITLADGFRALFSADYEGNEEDNSSGKIYNFNENLNLVYGGKAHIVEARGEVKKTDTLFVKMWFVTKRAYQLQMKGDNFASAPGIKAWLEDTYLATKQELALGGDITTINFEVNNDSASSKSDRFRIVFENNTSVLPVTITKVSAQPKNGGAEVNWTVANETNIKGYTVEKSTDDGRTFMQTGTQQPARNNPQAAVTSYSDFDATPKAGDNFYRIRIEEKNGNITYSEVVKVTIGASGTSIRITLYPNPVKEGKANLQLTNLKEGTYLAGVYTGSGQTVYQKKVYITLSGTTQTEALILGNNLAQGSYQIKVTDNKGNVLFTDKLIVAK